MDKKHTEWLNKLINNDLEYDKLISSDSIILWEKQLAPILEKNEKYELLFQFKLLAIQAYIQQNNISLAINDANRLYQKAKAMNYSLGIAFALKAIGATYLISSSADETINAYQEALKIFKRLPNTKPHIKSTLCKLIFVKIKTNKLDNILPLLEELQAISESDPQLSTDFYSSACYAYYYIHTNNPDKASSFLTVCKKKYKNHPFIYYRYIHDYLFANYYKVKLDYNSSLNKYNKLLKYLQESESYTYMTVLKEKADLLSLMNEKAEACNLYEKINAQKDSIDILSYSQQINELNALYQVNQREFENQMIQKKIFIWGASISIGLLFLILYFIIRIKKSNEKLLKIKYEQEIAKQQAERSIRTKSIFLSNMSHEIRTPLNALSGFSSILTEDSIDNETRQQCNEIILQNSELLLKLIDDVIDLSTLEMGQMQFKFHNYDAISICKNVIDMVNKIKQTQAELYFNTTIESLLLYTDRSRLQQVLINLLINSTKFTTKGSITLEMKLNTPQEVLFSITDTGCGIPKEQHSHIFNRFEKLNENIQGTGLGLSICELIISHLGGRIWIDSTYENGSRFFFTHPIINQEEIEENEK